MFRDWNLLGQTLLIIDNVSNLKKIKSIISCIPYSFKVLVTTQQRNLDANFNELLLHELQVEHAQDLLKNFVEEKVGEDPNSAEEICRILGCLPLGLELVGRYLADDPDLNLKMMLDRLNANIRILDESLNLSEEDIEEKYWMTARMGVNASCELIWQKLDDKTQYCAQIIGILGFTEFSWQLLEMICDDFDQNIDEVTHSKKKLYKNNLIKSIGARLYKIHELVKDFFYLKAQNSSRRNKIILHGAKGLSELSAKYYGSDNQDEYSLESNRERAKAMSRRALELRQEVLFDNHPVVIDSINNLGLLTCHHKANSEGENLLWKSLFLRENNTLL